MFGPHSRVPLFEPVHLDFVSSRPFDALTAQPFVDKSAMLVSVKLVSEDGSAIKAMHHFPVHVEGILYPAAVAKVVVMEVIVPHEHKEVLAQAKIEADLDDGPAVESPTTINPY